MPSFPSVTRSLPQPSGKLWPFALLTLAVAVTYASACLGAFMMDDDLLIVNNPLLRDGHSLGALLTGHLYTDSPFYRPVQMLVCWIIYQLAGPDPFWFHVTNIAVHAANACLVYILGCRLGFKPYAALAAALIWAVHPLHTEAISYISGLADPLSVFFCLLGVIVLLPDFAPRKFMAALPLFVLALLSKESAVVFPLLVMVTILFKSPRKIEDCIRTEFLWLIEGAYLLIRFHGEPENHGTIYSVPDYNYATDYASNIISRIYTCLATLPDYAQLLFWPIGLHEERAFPVFADPWHGQVMVGGAMVVAALAIIILCWRSRAQPLSWGLLWFAMAFSINSGIPLSLDFIIAEHWMYLPSVGLFLGLAETAARCLKRVPEQKYAPVLFAFVAASALALGVQAYNQNKVWHDVVALLTNSFAYERSTSAAHIQVGNAYLQQGDYDRAIEQYRLAINIMDKLPIAPANLAVALFDRKRPGDIDEAITNAERALTMSKDPAYAAIAKEANETLASIYAYKGDEAKAACYRAAAEAAR